MSKRSNRTGKLSHAHFLRGAFEAGDVPPDLRIPIGEFQSEGDRFGVHSMSASHHGRVFEFPRPAFEDFRKTLQALSDDVGSLSDEQGLSRVDYIVGSKAIVKPAGMRANDFGDGGGEGDDIVPHFGFNFLNAM